MPTEAKISCVDPNISLDQLFNSILVRLDDGTTGLRTIVVSAAANTINDHPECGSPPLPVDQIFRRAFGLTATGKTALVLIEELDPNEPKKRPVGHKLAGRFHKMECGTALQSFAAVSKTVMQYDPTTGCSLIRVLENKIGDDLGCNDEWSPLAILNRATDIDTRLLLANVTISAEAELCDTITPRVTCGGAPSLETYFREAIAVDDADPGLRRLRVIDLADVQLGCQGCDRAETMMERLLSSFVLFGGKTYILMAPPGVGDHDFVDCRTTGVSYQALISGALAPVGDCGLWAWRAVFT